MASRRGFGSVFMLRLRSSDSGEVGDRPVILDVARVQSGLRLEHQQVRLLLGNGEMLNASGNDDELALFQPNVAIGQPDQQSSLYDEEEFILRIVMMPDELSLDLHQFDVRVVELADDLRTPVVLEEAELASKVYLFRLSSRFQGLYTS